MVVQMVLISLCSYILDCSVMQLDLCSFSKDQGGFLFARAFPHSALGRLCVILLSNLGPMCRIPVPSVVAWLAFSIVGAFSMGNILHLFKAALACQGMTGNLWRRVDLQQNPCCPFPYHGLEKCLNSYMVSRPRFCSQHLQVGSQTSMNPVPGDPVPISDVASTRHTLG